MGGGEKAYEKGQLDCLLAGLETGVLAVLLLLAWLALASAWYRRSIWTTANLMATNFYGEAAMNGRFTFRTWAGLALYVILYGGIGALFGLALRGNVAGLRTTGIGVLVGLIWYYLSFTLLWRTVNPLMTMYTHNGPMMAGHALYGGLLGRFPLYLRALAHSPGAPQAG